MFLMKNNKGLLLLKPLTFEPLSKDNWSDFVQFFERNGVCGKCFCMYFRLTNKDFEDGKTNGNNKKAMKNLVWANQPASLAFMMDDPLHDVLLRQEKTM